MSNDSWQLSYDTYEAEKEGAREALLAVGNGVFGTRGCLEECDAGEVNYPGTYIAGVYNRLESQAGGRSVFNEDFVNCPNWLPLTFKTEGGEWLDLNKAEIVKISRTLDFRNGVLDRRVVVRDESGKETEVFSRRTASMANPHVAAMSYSVKPLNYSGQIVFRSGLDADIINANVARYSSLSSKHLDPEKSGTDGAVSHLVVRTNQSDIQIAEVAKLSVTQDGNAISPEFKSDEKPGAVYTEFAVDAGEGSTVTVEKVVGIRTSLDPAGGDPLEGAHAAVESVGTFDEIIVASEDAWTDIWANIDIAVEGDELSQKLLRMHLYHTMVTASPHTAALDVGIPARGLHGEAYRGHIFWDELFILPIYNMQYPETAKATLMYRYRRLDQAREYAKEYGFEGAMFPWQSGSEGTEETQVVHLNPISGKWGDDYSSLQRHISLAVAFGVWEYYWTTNDIEFMEEYGAEMFFELARFWASKCELDEATGKYSIGKVMGPDEYHEKYPGATEGGLRDNAYTNIMSAWLMDHALKLLDTLSDGAKAKVTAKISLSDDEVARWKDISNKLNLNVSDEGILEQYAGYFDLKELDWDHYRKEYAQIGRMDRILKAEGKSPDEYKVSKQADAVMVFYTLSEEELKDVMKDLGHEAPEDLLEKNVEYYLARTSHGSTLSRLVFGHVANLAGKRDLSWELYQLALKSDYVDTQGGTTKEGIHSGVMAGTALQALTCYAGLDLTKDKIHLNPRLPDAWKSITFSIEFRGDRYTFSVRHNEADIMVVSADGGDREVVVKGETLTLKSEG